MGTIITVVALVLLVLMFLGTPKKQEKWKPPSSAPRTVWTRRRNPRSH